MGRRKEIVDITGQPKTITLAKVLESKILMTENPVIELGIAKSGGRWFKDTKIGACYRVIEAQDVVTKEIKLFVAETRDMKKEIATYNTATKEIKCCDCGAKRIVGSQDAFQVTRCVPCQKKHRNKKRAERQKIKRAEKSKERLLANLNGV